MVKDRIPRVNSLLKEVLSEVITREVKNPHMATLVTVTQVETSNDLHHAKVFISVIGTDQEKKDTLEALQSAAGFIAVNASKKVTMRYFPSLHFKLDTTVDAHMRIDAILNTIEKEYKSRNPSQEDES